MHWSGVPEAGRPRLMPERCQNSYDSARFRPCRSKILPRRIAFCCLPVGTAVNAPLCFAPACCAEVFCAAKGPAGAELPWSGRQSALFFAPENWLSASSTLDPARLRDNVAQIWTSEISPYVIANQSLIYPPGRREPHFFSARVSESSHDPH
jgi:hypothetical protein